MPFLIAPVDEQEYQEMLNSIDYRLIHHAVPSRVQDQTRPEKSKALSTGIDQMSVDEVTPIEPTLSDAGELPSTWASDVDLRHEEVLGPADPSPWGASRECKKSLELKGEYWGQYWTTTASSTIRLCRPI